MTETTVRVTRYEVSCLPEGHDLAPHMTVNVEYRGRGRWAVTNRFGDVLSTDGEWGWEMRPSERTDEWIAAHRFDRDTALELAKQEAPKLTVRGRTAAEWLAAESREAKHV